MVMIDTQNLSGDMGLQIPAAGFVVLVSVVALAAGRFDLAIYSLSFWHYLVYALAFSLRSVPFEAFKSDAVLLKTVSLAAFAVVLWRTAPNAGALAVMAAGFGLNIAAAARLGSDRTYYGVEVKGLPVRRVEAFPYSVLAHPMLLGNMAAFAGPLLDPEFRADWWPLAVIHVGLNFLVLVMETGGADRRPRVLVRLGGALVAGAAVLLISFANVWHFAAIAGVSSLLFGAVLLRRYSGTT